MATNPSAIRMTDDVSENIRVTGGGGGGGAVNVTQVAGNNINATPAAALPVELFDGTNAFGTATNPLIEGTHKSTVILTTTPLGANGVFTSAWFDTLPLGDMQLTVTVFQGSTGNLASNGFQIQTTDDTSNANTQLTVFSGTCTANNNNFATVELLQRYWRVNITNGTTLQTSFEVTATVSMVPPFYARGSDNNFSPNCIVAQENWTTLTYADAAVLGSLNVPNAYKTSAGFGYITHPVVTWFFNGATYDRPRTPAIFKTVSVAATVTGNTAVWTPAAGKKFRLMRFQVTAQGLAATATAAITISFQDSATPITIGSYDVDVPAVAGVVTGVMNISCGWIDLGNGFLSAAANNVLNFNISAAGAGTVGTYRVNACGTEE
jgi:uncharacterized protein affecting Mg2+/Co2+ transport